MSWHDYGHPFPFKLPSLQGGLDILKGYPQVGPRASGSHPNVVETRRMTAAVFCTPPIERLPTEILQHIFLLATVDDNNETRTKWLVPLVCRRWREAAIGYPRLWSCLSFEPTTRSGPRRLAQLAFQRAKEIDLAISMTWSGTAGNYSGRREKGNFISLALSRRLQWRALAITDNEFGVESNLAVVAEGVRHVKLQRLQSIRYHTARNRPEGRDGYYVFELVSSAPNLEELDLKNVDLRECKMPATLRVLRLDKCTFQNIDALYDALVSVPDLEVLHLNATLPYADIHNHPVEEDIPLTRLRTLSITLKTYTHDAWFFRQLYAPNLRSLHLRSGGPLCPQCPHITVQRERAEATYMEVYEEIADQGWQIETLDVAELSCPYVLLLEVFPTMRNIAVGRTSDLRAVLDAGKVPSAEGEGQQRSTPAFRLQELAIHDLDEPSFLLSALESTSVTPFSSLTRIFAPRGVALPWNLSVLSPNVGVEKEARAHERLHDKYPVTECWPIWASSSLREGAPARRRGSIG